MVTLIKIIGVFIVLISSFQVYSSEDENIYNERLELFVGSFYDLPLEEGFSIHISRKGLVDAQLLPHKVRLFGLKTGIVVLTLTSIQKGRPDFKYYIEVIGKAKKDREWEEIKGLSRRAGLSFSDETYELKGVSSKALLYYNLKKICEENDPCLFDANLSETAKMELTLRLNKTVGEGNEVLVKDQGAILILAECNESSKEKEKSETLIHLVGNPLLQNNILVKCKKDWHKGYYTLYSKMIVMENKVAKEIGLQTKLEIGSMNSQNFSNIDMNLSAALKNRKAKLIGEPVIKLLSGVEAHAQSGSELLFMKEKIKDNKETNTYIWKELGLDLKVKVMPLDHEKVHLRYAFLISNPSLKESDQIHLNKMESEIELYLDKSTVVGGIQFKANNEEANTVPFLDTVPIMGPLFKRTGENESESNIFLHFYLKESKT